MLTVVIFFLFFASSLLAQDSNRYTDSLFNYSQLVTNGVYAMAPELNSPYSGESLTHSEELKFHLFIPEDDTLKMRPLIIMIHGGGFVSGNKEHDDMMEFCRLFAKRGYVTATIQYRLGMNMLNEISGERAVYRGVQDSRAAVRFFKKNADLYGIDTSNIFLLGSSAGSFAALHNLYMNEESERPAGTYQISNFPPTLLDGPDLGELDAINPSLKYGAQPNGVISLWGAIQIPDLIKEADGEIPVFLVHGTDDNIVPFDVGYPFNLPTLSKTYGSKPINEKLIELGFTNKTYFVSGKGHEFYGVSNGMWTPAPNTYWDTVVTESIDFLWRQHKPEAEFVYGEIDGSGLLQFTDSSIGATKWEWNFGDGSMSNEQNPTHTFPTWGDYIVQLKVKNKINSWDTTSAIITYTETGIGEVASNVSEFSLSQNYPNPFNPSTIIKYSIPVVDAYHASTTNVVLKIYDILGREVATLVNKEQKAGNYQVEFNANNLPSGVYYYQLKSGSFVDTKKMILMK